MYDIAIIGAGPAGLSAAITARARNKQVVVVSNPPELSPLSKARVIDNYPGMPQVSGLNLLEQMLAHARDLGVELRQERAVSVLPLGKGFMVSMGSENLDAHTVILATGTQVAKPYPGEAEYLGRGVSYCATCDGMLFRNAAVCVVGLNHEAVAEANFLAELGAQVTFLARTVPPGLAQGISTIEGSVAEIQGDLMGVTRVIAKPEQTIPCNGVFILRPSLAPEALIAGISLKDGHIAVDEQQRTNLPGLFAAGDCTGKPYQISRATGDAQRATLAAVDYLDQSGAR